MKKHLLAVIAVLSVVAIAIGVLAASAPAAMCVGVGINC